MSSSSSSAPLTDRKGLTVLELIGRTPLVRLPHFERETPGVELYAKAEWQNPGGSVKDRAAARMIADGEASGALTPGLTIVDATSGNTGIAYAMIGAAKGYPVKLCLPENASPERKLILKAFGAELVLTSPLEGTDGAGRRGGRGRDPHRRRGADIGGRRSPDRLGGAADRRGQAPGKELREAVVRRRRDHEPGVSFQP